MREKLDKIITDSEVFLLKGKYPSLLLENGGH